MDKRKEIFEDCNTLGMTAVQNKIDSGVFHGKNLAFVKEWLAKEQRKIEKADKNRQEEQHTEKIDTELLAAKGVVGQMSATTTFMGKKVEALTVEVSTLDKRLNDLNATIKKASKSSSFVGCAIAALTFVITVVAILTFLVKVNVIN